MISRTESLPVIENSRESVHAKSQDKFDAHVIGLVSSKLHVRTSLKQSNAVNWIVLHLGEMITTNTVSFVYKVFKDKE